MSATVECVLSVEYISKFSPVCLLLKTDMETEHLDQCLGEIAHHVSVAGSRKWT
jgi:hypothetical protein